MDMNKFPSPFGVLSFLISSEQNTKKNNWQSFRLLSEFSHFLFYLLSHHLQNFSNFFPSPFGVLSFLIIVIYRNAHLLLLHLFSVSFRSSLISYSNYIKEYKIQISFPSPFGVLSFLIEINKVLENNSDTVYFPSPFGVLSFLIYITLSEWITACMDFSVSFRSSLISYALTFKFFHSAFNSFPSPFGVLSFLIFFILSSSLKFEISKFSVSFRSSLISYKAATVMFGGLIAADFPSPFGVLSFLIFQLIICNHYIFTNFSVSFRSSLISYRKSVIIDMLFLTFFRLLSEFSHFLLNLILVIMMQWMEYQFSVSFRSSLISYSRKRIWCYS